MLAGESVTLRRDSRPSCTASWSVCETQPTLGASISSIVLFFFHIPYVKWCGPVARLFHMRSAPPRLPVLHAVLYETDGTSAHNGAKMVGIQKPQMTKKTLILYHGDELVIQSDSFSYLLCNIFGHVAVSRIFPFVCCFSVFACIAWVNSLQTFYPQVCQSNVTRHSSTNRALT